MVIPSSLNILQHNTKCGIDHNPGNIKNNSILKNCDVLKFAIQNYGTHPTGTNKALLHYYSWQTNLEVIFSQHTHLFIPAQKRS